MCFLVESDKAVLKLGGTGPNAFLKKRVEGLVLPNFRTSCKAAVIDALWLWCKDRLIDDKREFRNGPLLTLSAEF